MKMPRFDIDLDKHYKATVVIDCPDCGRETRQHLASLGPDQPLNCQCGADISMSAIAVQQAQQKAESIRSAYRVH